MERFLPEPLEPIVDPRWEHLVIALNAWGSTMSQFAGHLSEYNELGPHDGAALNDLLADMLRRFLPHLLEEVSQELIDDTALGVNLVNDHFSKEVFMVPRGAVLGDFVSPPRNRAERRRDRRRR